MAAGDAPFYFCSKPKHRVQTIQIAADYRQGTRRATMHNYNVLGVQHPAIKAAVRRSARLCVGALHRDHGAHAQFNVRPGLSLGADQRACNCYLEGSVCRHNRAGNVGNARTFIAGNNIKRHFAFSNRSILCTALHMQGHVRKSHWARYERRQRNDVKNVWNYGR